MLKQIWILLLLLLFTFSCGKTRTNGTEGDRFRKYVTSLREIHTPLKIECGLTDLNPQTWYTDPDSTILETHHLGMQVYGTMFSDRTFVTLLCGEAAETNELKVQTFSQDGRKIDSLYLGGGCGGEDYWWSSSSAQITMDGTVLALDTTWFYRYSDHSGLDSMVIESRRFVLLSSGVFAKNDSSKVVVERKERDE